MKYVSLQKQYTHCIQRCFCIFLKHCKDNLWTPCIVKKKKKKRSVDNFLASAQENTILI